MARKEASKTQKIGGGIMSGVIVISLVMVFYMMSKK